MMFNLIASFGVVGAIFGVITLVYTLFVTAMFAVYKATGGKLSYWKYLGLW